MTTYGPWLGDAAVVERAMVLDRSGGDIPGNTWGWVSESSITFTGDDFARLQQAWNLGGTVTGPGVATTGQVNDGKTGSRASWVVSWVTIQRPDPSGTVVSSSTPGTTDPAAVDIEWEPTSAPIGQRLTVGTDAQPPDDRATKPINVLLVDDVGTRYEPPIETAAAMRARPVAFQITPSAGAADQIDPPGLGLGGTGSFAVALLDYWTANGVAYTPLDAMQYPVSLSLRYRYRPRYRFVYASNFGNAGPALRQVQRGDGYGIGGVPRAVTGRTRQASLRSGPGAIL